MTAKTILAFARDVKASVPVVRAGAGGAAGGPAGGYNVDFEDIFGGGFGGMGDIFSSFFGGAAGLGISYGLSAVINHFVGDSGFKSIIPFYLAVGAVLFSVTVAMLSGLYPAIRAMRLSPLNAIRNE